jgi:pilus assembly protein FimV
MEHPMSANQHLSLSRSRISLKLRILGAATAWLISSVSWAVDLGGITVLSNQGEPLRARIEVAGASPAELAILEIKHASPASYAQAGLQYRASLAVMTVVIRRRADGSAYVDISTRDAIEQANTDLLLTVRWSSGMLQREFALQLLPNPNSAQSPVKPSAPTAVTLAGESVQNGDTASEIIDRSFQTFGQGVSANQALIALQRKNAAAFIKDNINLIKAGATVTLPSAAQVRAVDAGEADRLVQAQLAQFQAYKQRLANNATQAKSKQDPTAGSVQQEQVAKPATGDRLELKATQDSATELEAIAQAQAAQETTQREAAAQQRINELQALKDELTPSTDSPSAAQEAATAGSESDVITMGTPLKEVPTAEATVNPTAVSTTAQTTVSAPDSQFTQLQTMAVRIRNHAFWQQPQVQHPLFWPIAAALLALLLWLFIPKRKRAEVAGPDSSDDYETGPVADNLGPTANPIQDATPTATSAEADSDQNHDSGEDNLSKAYGLWRAGFQDLAVHTLNQALAFESDRPDYYMALLDFHKQRGAQLAFEATARELNPLVDLDSAEWAQCCDWGRVIDPENELYTAQTIPPLSNMTDLRASDLDLKDKS